MYKSKLSELENTQKASIDINQARNYTDNVVKNVYKAQLEKTALGAGEASSAAGNYTRNHLLGKVENPKLKNAVKEIYRSGATIGDGGLADAVRHEMSTGELVGGKSHIQKARERVTNLESIIRKQNLSSEDLTISNKVLDDLNKALGGK